MGLIYVSVKALERAQQLCETGLENCDRLKTNVSHEAIPRASPPSRNISAGLPFKDTTGCVEFLTLGPLWCIM